VCVDVCADSNCHFYLCNGVIESEESDAESSNSVENRSIDCANPLTGVFGVEVVTGFVAGVRFSPLPVGRVEMGMLCGWLVVPV